MSMSKIRNVETDRTADLAACATRYLDIRSCPGGRPIVRGYICPHCGYDTSDGDCGGVQDFVKKEKVRG